ncbi:helicase associated domain-containing protein [Agromyces badenianii]|uniref:helicase associated domain-containing protein n=1 Tax=Agromyces badenianii TaxID=2080742 RepID=UPI0011B1F279|nr:helicase associated domain-containing protein [Agromyces badenianii]
MLAPHPGATDTVSRRRDASAAPDVRERFAAAPTAYADDLDWERAALAVVDSAVRDGRLPSSGAGTDPEERRRARWLRHQRELSRSGALRRWRSEWLDLHLPGWQRPLDGRWHARAVGVATHRVEHGTLPSMNAVDEQTRRLGNWLHAQRRLHRAGELDPLRGVWLDLNLPGWHDPTAESWYANAENCALLVADTERFPSASADDAAERRLAIWLRTQRAAAKGDRLGYDRRQWLDEAIPGWNRSHESAWYGAAEQLVAFRQSAQRMPRTRSAADPAERRLGVWLARQRSRQAAGRLPVEYGRWLDERVPCWRARASEQWSGHLECTVAFASENGRLPARSRLSGERERELAIWLGNQRTAARRGCLSADRRRQLDDALPGWPSARGTAWSATAEALARYHRAHGRLPGLAEADAEPRRLALWLSRQRAAANAGSLPLERERWLRQHVPGWRIHHLSAWLTTAERVACFRGTHGRLPTRRNSAPPLERELGVWLNNQRTAARSAQLAPERRHWLDEQLPGWDDPRFAAWTVNARAVAHYREASGYLPHGRASDRLARRLGSWLDTQRSALRAGALDQRKAEWLDRHLGGWAAAETVGPPSAVPRDDRFSAPRRSADEGRRRATG